MSIAPSPIRPPTRHRGVWIAVAVLLLLAIAAFGFYERPIGYFDAYMKLRMAFTGVRMRSILLNGDRIVYLVAGPPHGPAVVLIHGLGGRAQDWRALEPYLVRAGYRVYMPDLLGYGASQKPRNFSYSVSAEAGVVIGFMNALGLKHVDLGGWSMGGWVTQLVAAEDPLAVEKLMLFDSAGLADMPTWNIHIFTPKTPAQLNRLDALLRPDPPSIPGFVAHALLRLSAKDAWVIDRAMDSMLTGRDVTNTMLPRIEVPVLLVWGKDDRCIPLDQGEQMHQLIPHSQLVVVPGCGHLAPLYCAGAIGPKATAFLSH